MKKGIAVVILLFTGGSWSHAPCFAQQDTTAQRPVKIVLADGSELIGSITAEDSVAITFQTLSGISMTIPRIQVKSKNDLAGYFDRGRYFRPDYNSTRLFFAPTARPVKSGQGYVSAYQIFFPFLAVGIGDYFTFGGGISLLPGVENQIYYLMPKFTPVNLDNFSVSGGVLYINSTGGESDGTGIIYGVTTYGSPHVSLTAGLGWGFSGSETSDKPIILLGGELRVSNSIKLITENWFPVGSDVSFISFGIRFFGDRVAADFGLVYPAGSEISGFPFFPWLGFAYNLGMEK